MHPSQLLEKVPGMGAGVVAATATVLVMAEDQMLFVQEKSTGLWGLPSGACGGDTALEVCRRNLQDQTGTDINVIGAHSNPERTATVALAQVLHSGGRPNSPESKRLTKWISIVEGYFEIPEAGMVFSSGTAAQIKETIGKFGHKLPPYSDVSLGKMAGVIAGLEVSTEAVA